MCGNGRSHGLCSGFRLCECVAEGNPASGDSEHLQNPVVYHLPFGEVGFSIYPFASDVETRRVSAAEIGSFVATTHSRRCVRYRDGEFGCEPPGGLRGGRLLRGSEGSAGTSSFQSIGAFRIA